MSTPVASGTLYASVADLRNVMAGTDSGTGTADQLTDTSSPSPCTRPATGSSVYTGNIYDSSTAVAVPPPILHDLALDLACFWATKTYLKNKEIADDSPGLHRIPERHGHPGRRQERRGPP